MSLVKGMFKMQREMAEAVDPEKIKWAEEYLKWYALPQTKLFIEKLKTQAMSEGLNITTQDEALIVVGKRQKIMQLLAEFENEAKIARQLLGLH